MRLPQPVLHALIRRKAALHRIPMDRFRIRMARTAEEYMDAFRLLYVSYAYQGFERVRSLDLRMTEQHLLPETVLLLAYEDDLPVGTISVSKDSEAGLPLEADYPQAIGALRQKHRLAEIGSFAVVNRCRHSGLSQLLSLAATRVAFRTLDAGMVVVGVNPRAVPFYRALWGFSSLGPSRGHAQLRAPVAGLGVTRDRALSHFGGSFRKPMMSGLRPVQHLLEGPPLPCVHMYEDGHAVELDALKVSREVFRAVFVDHSNKLERLSPRTWTVLRKRRTDETLGLESEKVDLDACA
jgi:hypothetical protein